MRNLKYIIDTLFGNNSDWDIDWISKEEFKEHCMYLWALNEGRFKHILNFEHYFRLQKVLAEQSPTLMKMLFKKEI